MNRATPRNIRNELPSPAGGNRPGLSLLRPSLLAFLFLSLTGCFAGGIVDKGGHTQSAGILPSATMTRGAPYRVVCYDRQEEKRREEAGEQNNAPPLRYVDREDYTGGCEETGESSVFFLFNAFPVTPPLNIEYAISQAVQKLEGDSMVNIRYWHEVHYYSLLGRVSVLNIKGDVVKFLTPEEAARREKEKRAKKRGTRR